MLYESNIHYEYEKELILDGVHKLPDFTIEDAESGETWYWEHCGMMHDEKDRKKWEEKKKFYEVHGIIENENLIVTVENGNGFDSSIVKEKNYEIFKITSNTRFNTDIADEPQVQVKRMLNGRCAPVQRGGGISACRSAHSAVKHAD